MITRKGYYQNINVRYEIIHQLLHRETLFLPFQKDDDGKLKSSSPVRWTNCSCLKFLDMNWERYKFLDNDMNLYVSLATYRDFPTFSFSFRIKSAQQQIWMSEFKNYITKYDCFLETDHPDIMIAHKDSKDIKAFFDRYKVIYSLKTSANKGFHFIIPAEEFDWLSWKTYDDDAEKNVKSFDQLLLSLPCAETGEVGNIHLDKVLLFKIIGLRMKTLLACPTIDTSVFDVKRVAKVGYSWDVKSNLIAYPLDDQMFENFSKALVTPDKVLTYNNYKRGLLWRNTDVPKEERQTLCRKMLVDLGILR